METINIAIVEDDNVLAYELAHYLSKYGYQCYIIDDFKHVDTQVSRYQPHVVLMDVNLPYYDGFYWCHQIRLGSQVPIIFISSRNGDNDTIMAIVQGGDDYIEKPFNLPLLKAKIEAIVRRTYHYRMDHNQLIRDGIYFNAQAQCIEYKQQKFALTKSENTIIKVLMEHKGNVVSRNVLMDELWNTDEFISDNTLTVLISRLRNKLNHWFNAELSVTKKGVGYYIE